MKYNDNGYQEWLKLKNSQKQKRGKLLLILICISILITLLIYLFGYDSSVDIKEKNINIIVGLIGIIIMSIIITNIKYKIPKFIKRCNKCGNQIKNIKKDCNVGKIKDIGTIDKVVYETKKSKTTGKTEHYRGGYAPKNNFAPNVISEATYETTHKIPITKKYHIYDIEYICKNCNTTFCVQKYESLEPLSLDK